MRDLLLSRPPEIPEHLKDGWRAYAEWAEAMARAGEPLPPGGCFILNRNTILAGCLVRLQLSVASELKIPTNNVRIRVERGGFGGLEPCVDVDLPKGWLDDVYFHGVAHGQRANELARVYVKGVIERYYQAFKQDIESRMEALAITRPDLESDEIEDLLEGQEDNGEG